MLRHLRGATRPARLFHWHPGLPLGVSRTGAPRVPSHLGTEPAGATKASSKPCPKRNQRVPRVRLCAGRLWEFVHRLSVRRRDPPRCPGGRRQHVHAGLAVSAMPPDRFVPVIPRRRLHVGIEFAVRHHRIAEAGRTARFHIRGGALPPSLTRRSSAPQRFDNAARKAATLGLAFCCPLSHLSCWGACHE